MVRLPPAEKLSLALRKNLRDEWDSKKDDLAKTLSEHLGTTWTIDVNPLALFPYAHDDYGKNSLGSLIHSYISSAIDRLNDFQNKYGDEGKKEINTIVYDHVLTIDVDEAERFSYCGADVNEGKLRIVFKPGNMGTNAYYALDQDVLMKALNDAPAPPGTEAQTLSYTARVGIREEYEPNVEASRKKLATMFGKPDFKIVPNFEGIYAKLKEESAKKNSGVRDDYERQMGYLMKAYVEGLVYQLEYQKFGEDELITEGFNDVVGSGEIHFRIVDKLVADSYCECVVEDDKLYMQCLPKTFGTNVDYCGQNLVDKL